jgi:hypothetical protein
MTQLKRRSSLQRKGFGYDRASVALDVWDSVVGHWDSTGPPKWQYFNPSQRLAGLGLPSCYDNTKTVRTLSFICYRK